MRTKFYLLIILAALGLSSCIDTNEFEDRLDKLEAQILKLEDVVIGANDNAIAASRLLKENILVLGFEKSKDGYIIELEDGQKCTIHFGKTAEGIVPIIGVDENGNWISSVDGGLTYTVINGCSNAFTGDGTTPQVKIDSEGYWIISTDNGSSWSRMTDRQGKEISALAKAYQTGLQQFFTKFEFNGVDRIDITLSGDRKIELPVLSTFYLRVEGYTPLKEIRYNESKSYKVEMSDVAEAAFTVPEGWSASLYDNILTITGPLDGEPGEYEIVLTIISSEGYLRQISFEYSLVSKMYDSSACKEWNDFATQSEDNLLLDFSYAGYDHGESAPEEIMLDLEKAEAYTAGGKTYTVYTVNKQQGISDREVFLNVLTQAFGSPTRDSHSITFEGSAQSNTLIYFPEGEYVLHTSEDDIDGKSQGIIIKAGNFVIKGAGREKTTITMNGPMQLKDPSKKYSSPDMLEIKNEKALSDLTDINSDAQKGDFRINVSSAAGINAGDWICLYHNETDQNKIAEELGRPSADISGLDIYTDGIEIFDYHQVASKSANKITLYEPLMHKVGQGWKVKKFNHFEQVGIEDLKFKGNANEYFVHHGENLDDGGFKPISMSRVTNSWIRRVDFESTSEACSIIKSANVTAYDIKMYGNRGHAAIRSQASSRVLIAATSDETSDNEGNEGNWHGVGVSEHTMGTVLYRNRWGDDSCFESHATQPRATLIDCCTGGWNREHQGGDSSKAPHHLDDLTIWNFSATKVGENAKEFDWWDSSVSWWKFLPPVIVGFQANEEVKLHGTKNEFKQYESAVSPESLYEAQLSKRLGYLPGWLHEL